MTTQPPLHHAESGASRPGSRRMLAAVAGALAILTTGLVLFLTRSDGPPASPFAPSHSSARYGGIPSWLPKPKVRVGRVASADEAHPWIAIEGDTVDLTFPSGRLAATLVGPSVPHQGPPIPATTPCTFTLTLVAASGAVPLDASQFRLYDERGNLHLPRVTLADGSPPPARVRAGQRLSLTLRAVLPSASGELVWVPTATKPIVSWEYVVEID